MIGTFIIYTGCKCCYRTNLFSRENRTWRVFPGRRDLSHLAGSQVTTVGNQVIRTNQNTKHHRRHVRLPVNVNTNTDYKTVKRLVIFWTGNRCVIGCDRPIKSVLAADTATWFYGVSLERARFINTSCEHLRIVARRYLSAILRNGWTPLRTSANW